MGDVSGAGIYSAMIRNRTPLDSLDFEAAAQKPQLLGFGCQERKESFEVAQREK